MMADNPFHPGAVIARYDEPRPMAVPDLETA